MAIILDADVIIRGEKGIFDLQGWVAARPDEVFEVAAITVAELWHGVERAKGAQRATQAMLKMRKIDLEAMKQAYYQSE